MLELVAAYQHRGWRWPLRDGDEIEVWSGPTTCLGRLPVSLIRQMLVHYLDGAALQESVSNAMQASPIN